MRGSSIPEDPVNAVDLGDTTAVPIGTVAGGAVVDATLSTTFVGEGSNLYYTDARADARVATWALRTSPSGRAPKDRLPSDAVYDADLVGLGGGGGIVVVNTPGEIPTPGTATEGVGYFVQSDDGLRVGVEDQYFTSTATGTFTTIPTRTDLLVANSQPNANTYAVNAYVYFNFGGSSGFNFHKVVSNGIVKNFKQVSATTALEASKVTASNSLQFLGSESSIADALRFTFSEAANTEYFYLDTSASPHVFKRMAVGTFVAAGGLVTHYAVKRVGVHWDDIFGEPNFATVATSGDYNDLLNLPNSSSGNIPILGHLSNLLADMELDEAKSWSDSTSHTTEIGVNVVRTEHTTVADVDGTQLRHSGNSGGKHIRVRVVHLRPNPADRCRGRNDPRHRLA